MTCLVLSIQSIMLEGYEFEQGKILPKAKRKEEIFSITVEQVIYQMVGFTMLKFMMK